MTTFQERLAAGSPLERQVPAELRLRYWDVAPYGQGTLPEPIRDAIWRNDCKLRYMPDLVAARGAELVSIDCKDRLRSTTSDRYAVKCESVNFGLQLAALGMPMFYVFGDLGVLLPTEIMSYGTLGRRVTGSGAYYLVAARLAHNFDDIFGAPGQDLAA